MPEGLQYEGCKLTIMQQLELSKHLQTIDNMSIEELREFCGWLFGQVILMQNKARVDLLTGQMGLDVSHDLVRCYLNTEPVKDNPHNE